MDINHNPVHENWVPALPAFDPNSTPTPPGPHTPLTPLTPAPSPPSPPSPITSPKGSNGPGSITKPEKGKRRPSKISGIVKPLRCQFPGDANSAPCGKEFDRKCDLKKHAKRHVKPFPCRFQGCKNTRGFSSEKDRERHENCLHKKECLMCTECPHETPRKDNMKDHVIRKHGGKEFVEEIMLRIMAGPRTSPRPDGGDEEEEEE
ncbi:hypothetical protein DFP73DRAFT_536011 [Morchella snyderi]|nr:hypothetical protein DFP73DRAFT_536011 [Morchella snyderi]